MANTAALSERRIEVWTNGRWASLTGTKVITKRTLVAVNQTVFEYDFDKFASKDNPGVGPCLGS